uniref:Cat eye syndrome critical region protein 5 n=1 Tax=Accipiter nisus TaxID=211598 RepID=A0A8B9M4V3_9AVES
YIKFKNQLKQCLRSATDTWLESNLFWNRKVQVTAGTVLVSKHHLREDLGITNVLFLFNSFLQLNILPSFGFLFDIDGVLVRGKTPIPAAKTAFQKLVNSQGQFLVPVVFVTNAGNCLRQKKADQLSHLLGISQEQVMMSHSPLRMFKRYHEKCVLVSGQGPLLDIARDLGFCQPITIETLREKHPLLDVVDHDRRPNVLVSIYFSVVLFGEPVRWETNLQLIIDVLLTSGYPGNPYHRENYPHIPVLNSCAGCFGNSIFLKFGHGTFMVCLENIYKKITGKDLKYEVLMGKPSKLTYQYAEYLIRAQAAERQWKQPIQTLYAVGDNLMTDVYGANLYNRYLEENSRKASAAAAHCRSVLVCTGVYNPHAEVPLDTRENHIVPDVDAAVDLVFQLENFAPN